MNIIIRKAGLKDLSEISRLNKALFEYEDQFGHEYNLNWPYEEAGQTYFKERLENDSSIILLAVAQDTIIGYLLAFIKTYSYRKPNPICEIENMFVEEHYRKKGVGTLLMNAVKEVALEKDVKRLRVGAIAQNENALQFYRSQGSGETNVYLEAELKR